MVKKYSGFSLVGDAGAGTTGGAVADLSRDGVSFLSASETYALQAPTKGCRKTFVYQSSTTSAGATVRPATSSGNITFDKAGNGALVFAATSTGYQVLELIGVSSVQWAIASAYPVASTGVGATVSTF